MSFIKNGLNGFTSKYIMRYYVLELKDIPEDKLKIYQSITNKTKKIITNNSLLQEYKNELYR